MTRRGTYILTAVAAALYVFLNWAFANYRFSLSSEYFWAPKEEDGITVIAESSVLTYILLVLIVAAGIYQARHLPEDAATKMEPETAPGQVDDPVLWKRLLGNVYWSIFWLPVRFFVGIQWLSAGEHKIRSDAWMDKGLALYNPAPPVEGNPNMGFWERIVDPQVAPNPSPSFGWFNDFIQYMIDHEWYTWFAKLIAIGEFLVGLGLLLGALVGIAAFFGTLMNFNFMLAGTASTNPVLFGLGVFLVLAWKTAGYWGLDRYLLPALGAPWSFGSLFRGGAPAPRSKAAA